MQHRNTIVDERFHVIMGEQQQSYQNPWVACLMLGENVFATRFLLYSLGFIVLNLLGNWCFRSYHAAVRANPTSPPDAHSIRSLIASRPTVIAATVHAVATSIVAVGVLVAYYTNIQRGDDGSPWTYQNINLVRVWQRIGLPISLSYFAIDSYFYCLPRMDFLIFVHHLIMVLCHYPVVAGWAGRVVMFSYLLIAEIYPRMPLYVEQEQMFTYWVMVFGHASIGVLSLHWCLVMCRGGLRSLFVFEKKRPKVFNPNEGFSFAANVAGKNSTNDADVQKKSK